MSRLPAFFALLTLAGSAAVVAASVWRPLEPEAAEAAAAAGMAPAPLVRSPVAPLALPAGPVPDRVELPRREPEPPPEPSAEERLLAERRALEDAIAWRSSRALGVHWRGRLEAGVLLPREGVHFFTWDPVRWRAPSPPDRRHGTDRLVRTIIGVARSYAEANPAAARVAIGDLSRPGGGSFDARFGVLSEFGRGVGTLGHVSHQNGLDVDVYYPRRDRLERAPDSLEDVDLVLAQDLVDRFVAAGAQLVFVGPRTGLGGPAGIVQPLERHDDHLHVRLPLR